MLLGFPLFESFLLWINQKRKLSRWSIILSLKKSIILVLISLSKLTIVPCGGCFTIERVRYRRGHGFKPVQAWIFFRPYFHYCPSSAHYCEDHFHTRKSSIRFSSWFVCWRVLTYFNNSMFRTKFFSWNFIGQNFHRHIL